MRKRRARDPQLVERDRLVIVKYLENYTLEEVGQQFGITRERVRQILKREGITPRNYTPSPAQFRPRRTLTFREKFWAQVNVTDNPDECWEWRGGSATSFGYGRMRFPYLKKTEYSHRIAYHLTNGKPKNFVLHKCDNPPCCNPNHLFDGTQLDNIADRDAKGRGAHLRPDWKEKIRNAIRNRQHDPDREYKLNVEQVGQIKALLPNLKQVEIARIYGVHHSTISLIAKGKRWADVPAKIDSKNLALPS